MKYKGIDLQISCTCIATVLSFKFQLKFRFSNYLAMARMFKGITGNNINVRIYAT